MEWEWKNTTFWKIYHYVTTLCFRKNGYPYLFHCSQKGSIHCPLPRALSFWRTKINSGDSGVIRFSQLPHIHRAKDFHDLGLLLDPFSGTSHSTLTGFLATFQVKPLIGEFTFLRSKITEASNATDLKMIYPNPYIIYIRNLKWEINKATCSKYPE